MNEIEEELIERGTMALLGALHYSSHGMNLLGRFLTDECAAWNLEQKVSRTQLTAIVEHAISRGLVQRVTWKWLRDQKRWLIQNGYGLPHYGMPFEGDIDFTEQGVEFARDRYEADYGRKLPRRISQVHKNWRTILTTEIPEDGKQWVWSDFQQYVLSDFTYHVRIGKWCVKWWDRCEDGYRVTYRTRKRKLSSRLSQN